MNIAQQLMGLEQDVRSGTMRFFGGWFGRPMDNYHRSTAATFDGEVLKVSFNEGEVLEVWNPSGLVIEGTTLKIPNASKVKWSWYYYGPPRRPENLLYYEYVVRDNKVSAFTNSPWSNQPSIDAAAVEIC